MANFAITGVLLLSTLTVANCIICLEGYKETNIKPINKRIKREKKEERYVEEEYRYKDPEDYSPSEEYWQFDVGVYLEKNTYCSFYLNCKKTRGNEEAPYTVSKAEFSSYEDSDVKKPNSCYISNDIDGLKCLCRSDFCTSNRRYLLEMWENSEDYNPTSTVTQCLDKFWQEYDEEFKDEIMCFKATSNALRTAEGKNARCHFTQSPECWHGGRSSVAATVSIVRHGPLENTTDDYCWLAKDTVHCLCSTHFCSSNLTAMLELWKKSEEYDSTLSATKCLLKEEQIATTMPSSTPRTTTTATTTTSTTTTTMTTAVKSTTTASPETAYSLPAMIEDAQMCPRSEPDKEEESQSNVALIVMSVTADITIIVCCIMWCFLDKRTNKTKLAPEKGIVDAERPTAEGGSKEFIKQTNWNALKADPKSRSTESIKPNEMNQITLIAPKKEDKA